MQIGPTKGDFAALVAPQEGGQCVDARPTPDRVPGTAIVPGRGGETTSSRANRTPGGGPPVPSRSYVSGALAEAAAVAPFTGCSTWPRRCDPRASGPGS